MPWPAPRAGRCAIVAPVLEPDPSCCRDLHWRIPLPDDLALDVLAERLLARGWRDVSTAPFLRVLESEARHDLVIVPRTRRAQLRLDYLVPRASRREVAERVGAEIVASFEGAVAR